jgi:hypothetical protein
VAELIERQFQVHIHPEHVRKILKRRRNWTCLKPQRWAKERDEVAIDHGRRLGLNFRLLPDNQNARGKDTGELRIVLDQEFGRIHGRPELLAAFIRNCDR